MKDILIYLWLLCLGLFASIACSKISRNQHKLYINCKLQSYKKCLMDSHLLFAVLCICFFNSFSCGHFVKHKAILSLRRIDKHVHYSWGRGVNVKIPG
ncbi:hypothetical protein BD408DRAFT_184710 [Parasitella parasitica]|nr:hypothetical protein BD408DRAFT_184710 [Parasitella parasitica]